MGPLLRRFSVPIRDGPLTEWPFGFNRSILLDRVIQMESSFWDTACSMI